MRNTPLCFVALAIAILVPAAAPAQQCLKWEAFCDGIQIDAISGCNNIIAQWYHWDCASNLDMTGGKVGISAPNLCAGGNGNAAVVCNGAGDCAPIGAWTFTIDALDGTLDMNMGFPPTSCWIDELGYTKTAGACTGGPGGGPNRADEAIPSWAGAGGTVGASLKAGDPSEVGWLGDQGAPCEACPGDLGRCYCIVTEGVVDGCGGSCPVGGQTCKLGDYAAPFDGKNDGCRCG